MLAGTYIQGPAALFHVRVITKFVVLVLWISCIFMLPLSNRNHNREKTYVEAIGDWKAHIQSA